MINLLFLVFARVKVGVGKVIAKFLGVSTFHYEDVSQTPDLLISEVYLRVMLRVRILKQITSSQCFIPAGAAGFLSHPAVVQGRQPVLEYGN